MNINIETGQIKVILKLSASERTDLGNELAAILSEETSATYPLLYAIWDKI